MFRKHLTTALAALVVVGAWAPCAVAQSGRRLPRMNEAAREVLKVEAEFASEESGEAAGEKRGREGREAAFDPRSLNAGRPAQVVYAEHGGKHSNLKGKLIGVALVSYLIFVIYMTATSDGYAPSSGGAGGTLPRR